MDSSTTIRREADRHPTPYSLSCLQVYGKECSPVFEEECYAVNTDALGCEGFPPSFPGIQNTYWNLEMFFFQGNDIVTKIFPRTRMAAVWGLLFWWGFFLFESVFFLRSLSTTLNEWCFIFFQHRKFWWGGMLCKKQCYTSPVKCSKVGSFFTTKKAICLF